MKVSELAKELGTSTTETITLLKEVGVIVKNSASEIDDEAAKTLLELSEEIDNEQKAQEPADKSVKTDSAAKKETKSRAKPQPKPEPEAKTEPDKSLKEAVETKDESSETKTEAAPAKTKKSAKKEAEGDEEEEVRLVAIQEKSITIRDLSERINISISDLIKKGLERGFMLNLNQEIEIGLASELALELGVLIDHEKQKAAEIKAVGEIVEEENEKDLKPRPPVVTIMGHVDHGKTKLLDTIRKSNVIASEAGGITQHIGAYQVVVKDQKITFIDTPGHAAFTKLRARGAQVTDIVIIVIAADDGIMPQTIEAIDHAKAARVPIVVAINKIDKPEANVDRVKQQLTEHDLAPEEWGGKTVALPISAIDGTGISELLEMLLLVAEVQELKANPNKKAVGIVLESHLSKSRGPVSTVLIKSGTLSKGDPFVIGSTYGKVRAMFDPFSQPVKEAPPAFPVEVLGISEPPNAGDILEVVADEKESKSISDSRKISDKQERYRKPVSLEDFSKEVKENKAQNNLNIVLKGDVSGSLEAISGSLQKLKAKNIGIQILHQVTGMVNESDVMLALASNAIILAFGVDVNPEAEKLAEIEKVSIRQYNIIYKLIDDIQEALEGMLAPEYEEIEIGKIEVRTTFKSSRAGTIAGCFVTEGKAVRSGLIKVLRKDEIVFSGKLDNLKRFKEDAKEVQKGYECGLSINDFNDFREDDLIVVSEMRQKERKKKKKT
ncbi:translation initiation factor IF-2 [Candidatus Margulisiibacteriota bacterium]